jgi:GR25 family glycosyltransferase involved in LPS biosynthesis
MQTNYIDGAFYINMDKRSDRRVLVEKEFMAIGLDVERFVGIERTPGIVGCGYSHLAVLKEARDRGYKNVLIFEDDFEFLVSRDEFWAAMDRFFSQDIPYDVVMLSHFILKSEPFNDFLVKVHHAETASAYIVHNSFYDSLITLYEENLPLLITTGKHWIYANDQIWRQLMPMNRWYAFTTRLGKQRASFSDNSLMFKDLGF